jgi:hypothetical protein
MSLRAVLEHYRDDPILMHEVFQQLPFVHPLDFAHLRLWEISVLFLSVMKLAQTLSITGRVVCDPYRLFVSAKDQHFKTVYPNLPLINMRPQESVRRVSKCIFCSINVSVVSVCSLSAGLVSSDGWVSCAPRFHPHG